MAFSLSGVSQWLTRDKAQTELATSQQKRPMIHLLQSTVFGGILPQKSVGFWNSNDVSIVSCFHLEVKVIRKTEKVNILELFLEFCIGLKIFIPLKQNHEFHFEPKIQYARAAEHREAASSDLAISFLVPRLGREPEGRQAP